MGVVGFKIPSMRDRMWYRKNKPQFALGRSYLELTNSFELKKYDHQYVLLSEFGYVWFHSTDYHKTIKEFKSRSAESNAIGYKIYFTNNGEKTNCVEINPPKQSFIETWREGAFFRNSGWFAIVSKDGLIAETAKSQLAIFDKYFLKYYPKYDYKVFKIGENLKNSEEIIGVYLPDAN